MSKMDLFAKYLTLNSRYLFLKKAAFKIFEYTCEIRPFLCCLALISDSDMV